MAVLEVKKSASKVSISKNVEISIPDGVKVKHTGVYDFIDTSNEGIKKVVSKQGGYLVFLDYGRVLKTNKRTGLKELKQDKTIKRVNSEAEAKKLKAEAELIRKQRREKGPEASLETHKASKITMEQVVKNFKAEGEYRDMSVDYQMHFDNYCNHILDYFRDFEPCKITTIDIENFFKYQLENGCLYDNRVGAEKGLSINTLGKHKTALKKIWNYMIKAKKYGVSENIVIIANLPKVEVEVDGKKKKVAKIPYVPKSLTLDELNYTLNDIAQNEFDRSLLLLVAMCSIGGLRRGEITALQLGKYYHNDLMNVSDEIFDYSGYDKKYYEEHDEFIMIAKQLNRRDYIIENLSYEQLIAKYNGLEWIDAEGNKHKPLEDYRKLSKNILWYLDPPYHPYCLNGMDDAPYANSFDYSNVVCMTKILSGENKEYGELHYFIKSDYNPKVTVANAKNQLEMIGTNKKEDMSDSERKIYDQCIGILVHEEEMMYDFDRIEDERKGFQCFCVGGFDKGAIAKEDEKLVKTVGYEYVWCKGLPAEYTDIPKVTDKV